MSGSSRWEAEGLLGDVEGEDREGRLQLLQELHEDGASVEELREAIEENRLTLLPVERALADNSKRRSQNDLAAELDMDIDYIQRQRRAIGLPAIEADAAVLTEGEAEMIKLLAAARDAGLPDDALTELNRVLGQSMSNIAAALRTVTAEAFIRAGDTEHELGVRYAEAARNLVPLALPVLEHLLMVHLRNQLRQDAVDRAARQSGRGLGGQEVGVAFADLVGFTRIGEEVPPEALGGIGERLAEMASDAAVGETRVVKMIGDAAMLVAPDIDELLASTFALLEASEEEGEEFPQLRIGVAHGEALGRMGDWYGRPVNLASRLTAKAYPASVLTTADVKEVAAGDYDWSFAGDRKIRGITGEVKLFRARPASLG